MSVLGVFDQRFRGFRVIEIGGVGVLLALILLVYLAKTVAGGESARIDHVQQQISDEQAKVTLLRAEVASLEQPERLETLSGRYLGLQPVDAKHEIDAQALAGIAGAPMPTPQAQPKNPTALAAIAAPATLAVAASSDAAKPAKVVVAVQSTPAKPAVAKPAKLLAAARPITVKPVMLATVARPSAAKPARLATAVHPNLTEPALDAVVAASTRPSELKPAAANPIDDLASQPSAPDAQTAETNQ